MFNGVLQILLYILIILVPVLIVTVHGGQTEGFILELGRNTALAAFMIIMLQVLMGARIKWLD